MDNSAVIDYESEGWDEQRAKGEKFGQLGIYCYSVIPIGTKLG